MLKNGCGSRRGANWVEEWWALKRRREKIDFSEQRGLGVCLERNPTMLLGWSPKSLVPAQSCQKCAVRHACTDSKSAESAGLTKGSVPTHWGWIHPLLLPREVSELWPSLAGVRLWGGWKEERLSGGKMVSQWEDFLGGGWNRPLADKSYPNLRSLADTVGHILAPLPSRLALCRSAWIFREFAGTDPFWGGWDITWFKGTYVQLLQGGLQPPSNQGWCVCVCVKVSLFFIVSTVAHSVLSWHRIGLMWNDTVCACACLGVGASTNEKVSHFQIGLNNCQSDYAELGWL